MKGTINKLKMKPIKKTKIIIIAGLTLLSLIFSFSVFSMTGLAANGEPDPAPAEVENGPVIPEYYDVSILSPTEATPKLLGTKEPLVEIILDFINKLVIVIGSVAILAIVAGGIVLIASSGNDTLQSRGKSIITYAIIGLVVALSSYIITSFIQSLFF